MSLPWPSIFYTQPDFLPYSFYMITGIRTAIGTVLRKIEGSYLTCAKGLHSRLAFVEARASVN
jgi:hypothetical protein